MPKKQKAKITFKMLWVRVKKGEEHKFMEDLERFLKGWAGSRDYGFHAEYPAL